MSGALPDDSGKFELGKWLQKALSGGGCAAVIYNSVDRAQKVYLALKPYFSETANDSQPVLGLLHARYLFGDRKNREERTLRRFGKNGSRPERAVLIAIQVIEQSLDMDFDLMLTDMVPVDLLLQRAGRLHRHERTAEERYGLAEAMLWVCQPEMGGGVPDFGGGTEAVYDYHVPFRTWLVIKDRPTIEIAGDVEELIEVVYDGRECPDDLSEELRGKWEESKRKHDEDVEQKKSEAEERWIK